VRTVRDVAIVACAPDEVWRFLTQLDHPAYLRWHPRDHLDFRRLRAPAEPRGVGQGVGFTERLGGRTFRFSCVISRSVEGRLVEFMPRRPLGLLLLGRGQFLLQPAAGGLTRLEAVVELGWRTPVAGPILDWVIGKVVDLAAVHAHMQEESRYLTDAAGCRRPRPRSP
jgi:hypothetical protein